VSLRSRQAIQKYIKANNSLGSVTDAAFKSHVNRAIAAGVKNEEFLQPKGEFHLSPSRLSCCSRRARRDSASPCDTELIRVLGASGTVKLAKKEPAAKAPAEKKVEKKTTATKAAPKAKKATATVSVNALKTPMPYLTSLQKKTTAAKPKAATTKKSTTAAKPKKTAAAAAKPKANTTKTRKTAAPAPAVGKETSTVLGKTKTGRVVKTKAPAAPKATKKSAPKKTAAPKKAATKKTTPKKATPKKAEA
jgi:histone H1/5